MKTRCLALAAILYAIAVPGSARMYCGDSSANQHDFRTVPEYFLKLVHSRHFTDDIEQGIRGESGTLGGDLEYTLVHIPNHPRALNTVLRLAPRNPSGIIEGAKMPIEERFDAVERDLVQAIVEIDMVGAGDNQQFLRLSRHLVGILGEIA